MSKQSQAREKRMEIKRGTYGEVTQHLVKNSRRNRLANRVMGAVIGASITVASLASSGYYLYTQSGLHLDKIYQGDINGDGTLDLFILYDAFVGPITFSRSRLVIVVDQRGSDKYSNEKEIVVGSEEYDDILSKARNFGKDVRKF